jgi:nicotinamidase-related amidase
MSKTTYPANRAAYLLVDPYNDFLSDGGKVYPFIKPIADQVGLLDNLRKLDREVRDHNVPVFFVPHRRWEPGDYENWDHPNPNQKRVFQGHHFARGEWGGEWHPDFTPKAGDTIVHEH